MHIKRPYDPHRDLPELRALERPACPNTPVPRGSHHISSLWSPVVATGGNRLQMRRARKRLKQAKTVAAGCDRLPPDPHGKGRVDPTSLLLKRGTISSLRKGDKSCEHEGPQDLTRRLCQAGTTPSRGTRSRPALPSVALTTLAIIASVPRRAPNGSRRPRRGRRWRARAAGPKRRATQGSSPRALRPQPARDSSSAALLSRR